MSISDKIIRALDLVHEGLRTARHPAVMSSFGKDSMVVLDLIKKCNAKIPVIFIREAHHPEKYHFANEVIEKEGYEVYSWPPFKTYVMKCNGTLEILGMHSAGKAFIYLPTGIKPPVKDKPYLCGLTDILNKPKGSMDFPWDLLFNGQKSSDVDPILGAARLKAPRGEIQGVKMVWPIEHFTDKDVWEYTERFKLPWNDRRYNKKDGYREFEDVTYNPDYFRACVACIDKGEKARVYCPISRAMVQNISDSVEYLSPDRPESWEKENA